ncbi:MAG TPA: hypothetical protein VM145_06405 [Sphingomicrobium sp.]|nr:hypothetical protein [Sphingomicrobium sp.]
MELHGTLENNLAAAIQSARRLKGHPVHGDTFDYWKSLLDHARRELGNASADHVEALIVELENEIADITS